MSNSQYHIIAEIGNNHQGDVNRACDLIRQAAAHGATHVKLQTRLDMGDIYTRSALYTPYEGANSFGKTYWEHRKALELPVESYAKLAKQAKDCGVILFSTPFDKKSAEFLLLEMGFPLVKIASGDITNFSFLRYINLLAKQTHAKVILSTGGATEKIIADALEYITPDVLMLCTSVYPCPAHLVHLNRLHTLKELVAETTSLGFSCHTPEKEAAMLAYALGARWFEFHFTLTGQEKGTDVSMSYTPQKLFAVQKTLASAKSLLGDKNAVVIREEAPALKKMRRVAVAKHDQTVGNRVYVFDFDFKVTLEPGGLTQADNYLYNQVELCKPLQKGEMLTLAHLKFL